KLGRFTFTVTDSSFPGPASRRSSVNGTISHLPASCIDLTAFSFSSPPQASRCLLTNSSTLWAKAGWKRTMEHKKLTIKLLRIISILLIKVGDKFGADGVVCTVPRCRFDSL